MHGIGFHKKSDGKLYIGEFKNDKK